MATATKSTEKSAEEQEKERQADQAKEQKALEAQQGKDAEAARLAENSRSASEAEAAATAELRVQKQAEAQQDLKDEAAEGEGEFGGHVYTTDNFSATTRESFGRQVVEIKPAGWVGEGFVISGSRVNELKKLVGLIKNLPKQE